MRLDDKSVVFKVEEGDTAVAMMLNGTSDSLFILERGVPSNSQRRIEEYLWASVFISGTAVQLTETGTNPLSITTPGSYRFSNMGSDDEEALIDVTVYKKG